MPKLFKRRGAVKALDDKGDGLAVIATLNVIDKDGDVTIPGAFGEQTAPMVPAHDWSATPIGKARIFEKEDQVLAEFKLNLKTVEGLNWYEALKFDLDHPPAKQEYSYGYEIGINGSEMGEFSGVRVRYLKKITVHEVSPVLLGAGMDTGTIGIKNGGDKGRRLSHLLNTLIDESVDTSGKPRHEIIAAIADSAGVSADAVRRVVRGDTDRPTDKILGALCDVLGCDRDRFDIAIGSGKDDPDPKPIKGAIVPLHKSKCADGVWDSVLNEQRALVGQSAGYYQRVYGWRDEEQDVEAKSGWKFIHHFVSDKGDPGDASVRACIAGIAILNGAKGGSIVADSDRRGIWEHLAHHLEQAEISPPVLRSIETSSLKLADHILWLKWDAETLISRLRTIQEIRAKEGRGLGDERVKQLKELSALIVELNGLTQSPLVDSRAMEALQRFNELRTRRLNLGT